MVFSITLWLPSWGGMISGLPGALTRVDVVAVIKRFDDAKAGIKARLDAADLATIQKDDALNQFAMAAVTTRRSPRR